MNWLGPLYRMLINVMIGYFSYLGVHQHDYAKVAGWVIFGLFSECDDIKHKIDSQSDRVHMLSERVKRYNSYIPVPSRCRSAIRTRTP